MTTLACRAEEYFSSIGPLAKKIQNDQENFRLRYGEEKWLKLTTEQQEHLLDKFFVDEATQEKYAKDGEDGEERPECFPKLMIPCGEKICVDFDNDVSDYWRLLMCIWPRPLIVIVYFLAFKSWALSADRNNWPGVSI